MPNKGEKLSNEQYMTTKEIEEFTGLIIPAKWLIELGIKPIKIKTATLWPRGDLALIMTRIGDHFYKLAEKV